MVDVSIVIPVRDEAGNAAPLAREIAEALQAASDTAMSGPKSYEMLFVDDGSCDTTIAELVSLRSELPNLRILAHGRSLGQSRAIRTGVRAAKAPLVVTLDGDGQNDPADIAKLLAPFEGATPQLGLVAGERTKRHDIWRKRAASYWANRIRRWLLNDHARDVGCGLKAFRREAFLALPYFDHIHRYLIALMWREGYQVQFVEVGHRPRRSGRSKYGVWDRFVVGITDVLGVIWLKRRFRGTTEIKEL